MPWKRPSSQPTSWACAIRSSPSEGVPSSVKGSVSRSSSSTSSGARPDSSSLIEAAWISLSRWRLASSSGAAFTSSSSWRIMLPIRITLAGCSTSSVMWRSPSPSSSPSACVIVGQRARGDGADRLAVGSDDDDLLLAAWSPAGSGCCCSVMPSTLDCGASRRLPDRPQRVRTIFPDVPAVLHQLVGARRRRRAASWSRRSAGSRRRRRAARRSRRPPQQIAAFSASGRARSEVAVTEPRLRSRALMSSSPLVPPCMPMITRRPAGGERGRRCGRGTSRPCCRG